MLFKNKKLKQSSSQNEAKQRDNLSIEDKKDHDFVNLLIEGNVNGFEVLYRKYSKQIIGFYMVRLKNEVLVSDLSQLTWEKVYKNIHRFDFDYKFSTWLYTIANRIMIDEFRKMAKNKKFKEEMVLNQEHKDIDEFVDPESSNDKDLNIEVGLALSKVKDIYKSVLEMRYLQEMTYEEIAQQLNMSVANVRKINSRALKKIQLG